MRRFDGGRAGGALHRAGADRRRAAAFLVAILDHQRQRLRAERLELAAAELAATLESTADGLLVTDLSGRIRPATAASPTCGRCRRICSRNATTRVFDWMRRSVRRPAGYAQRLAAIAEATLLQASDMLELHSGRVLERIVQPQCSRGRPVGRVWSFRDITERIVASQRIETLAPPTLR